MSHIEAIYELKGRVEARKGLYVEKKTSANSYER